MIIPAAASGAERVSKRRLNKMIQPAIACLIYFDFKGFPFRLIPEGSSRKKFVILLGSRLKSINEKNNIFLFNFSLLIDFL